MLKWVQTCVFVFVFFVEEMKVIILLSSSAPAEQSKVKFGVE